MVTTATNNAENKPFFQLDFAKFADKRTHSAEDVRNVLESRISQITEIPEDIGDDRAAKENFLRKRKEEMAYKNAVNDLQLFDKNPELYTSLFALKEATRSETYTSNPGAENERQSEKTRTRMCEDQNGNLFLAVEMLKPADVSFQIHDGKLTFDPKGMTPDQLKEIIAWLDHRGLASSLDMDSLKLENADSKTEELFASAKERLQEEKNAAEDEVTYSGAADTLTVGQSADDNTDAEENEDEIEGTHGLPFNEPIPVKSGDRNKAPSGAYDNAIESLTKWMNKNKRRNLSYFVTYKGGYTVFTAFDKENPENMEQDGIIDSKTKDVKTRNECKLYVKMNENGRLEISFSTPGGKPLSDTYADRIMDAYKDAGINRVKFGTMSDANEGAIRSACGRALIVPVGLKLSQTKFDKMIEAAEGKNGKNNPKVIKYRRDLALQFAYQLEQKGIKWNDSKNKNNVDCRCVRSAIGAYNMSPFRDWWEDFGLRGAYENIVKGNNTSGNKASEAIGAAEAVGKLYRAYNEGIDNDGTIGYLVSDKCKTLSEEEKRQFKQHIAGSENTPVRDMSPEAAKALFTIMQRTEAQTAQKNIEEEYVKLVKNEFYKGNAERDAVSSYLSNAEKAIYDVSEDIKDYGLPPVLICRLGSPKYDFSKVQEQLKKEKTQEKGQEKGSTSNAAGHSPSRSYGGRGG